MENFKDKIIGAAMELERAITREKVGGFFPPKVTTEEVVEFSKDKTEKQLDHFVDRVVNDYSTQMDKLVLDRDELLNPPPQIMSEVCRLLGVPFDIISSYKVIRESNGRLLGKNPAFLEITLVNSENKIIICDKGKSHLVALILKKWRDAHPETLSWECDVVPYYQVKFPDKVLEKLGETELYKQYVEANERKSESKECKKRYNELLLQISAILKEAE